MSKLIEIMQSVLEDMPDSTRFSEEDAQVIDRNQDAIKALGGDLVKGFYDTLYAYPKTAAVFREGERPMREESLAKWWDRAISGPFDETYWAWQTYVGLLHIKRHVSNPMMISMWGWVLNFLAERLPQSEVPEADQVALLEAFQRMAATTEALIGDSVFRFYLQGLLEATGFNDKLLDRMVQSEINSMLKENMQYRLST